jgi:uncharacterized protein RhaS with RHS repeats
VVISLRSVFLRQEFGIDSTRREERQRRSSLDRYEDASSGPKEESRFRQERYGDAVQVDCDDDEEDVRRMGAEVGRELEDVDEQRDIRCDVG